MNVAKAIAKTLYRAIPGKRPLYELVRGKLPERVYQHLHFHGPFTVPIDERHSFKVQHHGEIVENRLFWTGLDGDFEGASMRAWTRLAEASPGAILDVGANAGIYSLVARAVNSRSTVIAFEPLRRVLSRLQENVALNRFDIECVGKAVSDHSGSATLHDNAGGNNYSASLDATQAGNTISYEVETVALDVCLAARGWPPVSLVKIDVEKHEPAVLAGMQETIERFRPALLIEVLFEEVGEKVQPFLEGYDLYLIDEAAGLVPTRRARPYSQTNWNVLAVQSDDFVRAGLDRLLKT